MVQSARSKEYGTEYSFQSKYRSVRIDRTFAQDIYNSISAMKKVQVEASLILYETTESISNYLATNRVNQPYQPTLPDLLFI
jgi:hypothetical protein